MLKSLEILASNVLKQNVYEIIFQFIESRVPPLHTVLIRCAIVRTSLTCTNHSLCIQCALNIKV